MQFSEATVFVQDLLPPTRLPVEAPEPPWVLLVDDDPTNQLVYAAMLRAAGFSARTASSAVEGVSICMESNPRPSLVLMDLEMQPVSGITATGMIRLYEESRSFTRVPIVAFTTSEFPETLERAFTAGMDSVLNKPCTIAQMHSLCTDLIAGFPQPPEIYTDS